MSIFKQVIHDSNSNKVEIKWYLNLHQRISQLPSLGFLLLMCAISVGITLLLQPLFYLASNYSNPDLAFGELTSELMIQAVLVAPFIETILLQFIPIEILLMYRRKKRKNKPNLIFIGVFSAVLFGLMHFHAYTEIAGIAFGVLKVIVTFLVGLILSYTYLVYKSQSGSAVTATAILHMMMNFTFLVIHLLTT